VDERDDLNSLLQTLDERFKTTKKESASAMEYPDKLQEEKVWRTVGNVAGRKLVSFEKGKRTQEESTRPRSATEAPQFFNNLKISRVNQQSLFFVPLTTRKHNREKNCCRQWFGAQGLSFTLSDTLHLQIQLRNSQWNTKCV
jgi:hypothetical protein